MNFITHSSYSKRIILKIIYISQVIISSGLNLYLSTHRIMLEYEFSSCI